MKKAKVQRPFKHYRLGWVVGYIMPDIVGDNRFYLEEVITRSKNINGFKTVHRERRTRLFKSPEEARKVAEQEQARSTSQWFYRAWQYSTNNPENAKGLPEWTQADHEWFLIPPPGQRFEDVTPDPATLAFALSNRVPPKPEPDYKFRYCHRCCGVVGIRLNKVSVPTSEWSRVFRECQMAQDCGCIC